MGATTYKRYRDTHEERFAALVKAWLSSLPADGWRGGVSELAAALERLPIRFPLVRPYIPTSSGLSKAIALHEHMIRAAGWRVAFKRTAKARTVEFTRA